VRAILGVVILAVICIALSSPARAAVTTFNVADDVAICSTVSGKITFGTALHTGGAGTSVTVNAKGAISGCTDQMQDAVQMFKGTFTESFTATTLDCAMWFSDATAPDLMLTGTSTFTWVPAAGQDFAPKTVVAARPKRISTGPMRLWNTSHVLGASGMDGSYVEENLGNINQTGMFSTNTDIFGDLQQDVGNIFNQCASTNGLNSVSFGIGEVETSPTP
jgi:hypothetical protein